MSEEECKLCKGQYWFLYKNRKTKITEIRNCDLCSVFDDDEHAGRMAHLQIEQALTLTEIITEVRSSDERVRRATAKAFGEKEPPATRRKRED